MKGALGVVKGLWITFRHLFEPSVTNRYPRAFREKPSRFHGRHVLNRYPDGMEKCVGCEICAGVCPANCIYVRGAENPMEEPVSPGERYGAVFEINMLRCIFCGLCVEACPTEALTMTSLFEMSMSSREDGMFSRDELLMDHNGAVPHKFAEDPYADASELDSADGWLRATSPSGIAEYEGVRMWMGTRGPATWKPEVAQQERDAQ